MNMHNGVGDEFYYLYKIQSCVILGLNSQGPSLLSLQREQAGARTLCCLAERETNKNNAAQPGGNASEREMEKTLDQRRAKRLM